MAAAGRHLCSSKDSTAAAPSASRCHPTASEQESVGRQDVSKATRLILIVDLSIAQVIRDIGRRVMEIQNAGLGEHKCVFSECI